MSTNNQILLSPTTLNLYRECPRCFWLHVKKITFRPRGIFPSLPNGIDLFLKEYFDYFRGKKDLPPVIDELGIKGKIVPDQNLVNKWRKGEGLKIIDKKSNIILYGKLDEALLLENKYYVPFDFKTRGFPPQETHESHQLQMDIYGLLLKENKYPTTNKAYLAYFYPKRKEINFNKESLPFKVAISELDTNLEAVKQVFKEAIKCLQEDIPKPSKKCEYCQFVKNRKDVEEKKG